MNTHVNIKGLLHKEALKQKNFKANSTNIINGSLSLKQPLTDLFEIEISYELIEKNLLPFKDNNLIVFKGILNFNIIGSTNENLGVFLKESSPFLIKHATNYPYKELEIIFIDGFFSLITLDEISFSLVTILDEVKAIKQNDITAEDLSFNNDFDFDAEFI